MNFRKILLAFCIVMCILLTITCAAAGDTNGTAISHTYAPEETSIVKDEVSYGAQDIMQGNESEMTSESNLDTEPTLTDIDDETENIEANVIFYKQTGKYSTDKKIYIMIVDAKTGATIGLEDNIRLNIVSASDNDYTWLHDIYIDSSGQGMLEWWDTDMSYGTYILSVDSTTVWYSKIRDYINLNYNDATTTVYKNNVQISAKALSVPYESTRKFTIKVLGSDKKPAGKVALKFKIKSGSKWTTYRISTNSKGIATLNMVSKLSPGKHNVLISINNERYINKGFYAKQASSYIKVGKQSVTIKPTKLSTAYKSGKYFNAKVLNLKSKKAAKGIPITLTVYTGKNARTVTLKSDANGLVKYSSSKLSVGTHKVVLKVKKSKYYTGKAKSSYITIVKKKPDATSKAKVKTSIKLSQRDLSLITDQVYVRTDVVSTGNPYMPTTGIPIYEYVNYPKVKFTAVLKGTDGKSISGKYKAILRISHWSDGLGNLEQTFTGTFGQSKTVISKNYLDDYYKYVQLEIHYSGNSKYSPSKIIVNLK